MHDLPEHLFANPVWHALRSKHRHFAISHGEASRYPADVTPFAAVSAPTPTAFEHLHSLLAPAEPVWVVCENLPPLPEFSLETRMDCLQMVLPESITPADPADEIVPLANIHAPEMVALTDLAFPGFFRPRTNRMGTYYGIRAHGELIAMGGERLTLDGYPEISGVCTHPAHRGRGLAATLIWHLVRDHRRQGLVSWLHVGCQNRRAIDLYLRMGFRTVRTVTLHRISRHR